jgi:DUF4097 and DUF4098 domain-containing protein YvlB
MAATMPPRTTGSPRSAGPLPLTRGRVAALVIGVPVCLLLVAYTGFDLVASLAEGSYHVSYTAPANAKSLTVNTAGGQVSIKPTTAAAATVAGTARYTFVRATPTEHTVGGNTTVAYHCVSFPVGTCAFDAAVSIPATMPVSVNTAGGDATVTGIRSSVTLSSGGGNLSADHIFGLLSLNTSGGGITATAVTAPAVTASTGGGNITAAGVAAAKIVANTSGGDIKATGISSAAVIATSGGGNVEVDFTSVPSDVQVDTSGGDITLVLPPGATKYRVDAHTSGGNVNDSLPLSGSSPHVITATSGGGDITIRQQ